MKNLLLKLFEVPEYIHRRFYRLYQTLNLAYFLAFLAHIAYIFLFFQLGIFFLSKYNIFSSIFFLIVICLNRRGYLTLAYSATISEFLLHAFLVIYAIGWNSGFHYVIILLPLGVGLFPWKNSRKIFCVSLITFGYLLINKYSLMYKPIISIDLDILSLLNYYNLIFTFCVFGFIGHYYQSYAEKAEKALEHEMEKTEKVFANISYEFRTPLTLLLAPVESIKQGEYGENISKRHSVFNTILENGLRLLNLINSLFDYTKVKFARMPMKKQGTDISKLLSNYVSTVKSAADSKRPQILFNDNTDGLIANIDRDLIEKAVFNLISNAFKFTPESGTIIIKLDKGENDFRISVIDTGIGIQEDRLEDIFDRFSQVEGSAPREYEGTGIGLALAKEIAELHKGSISVRSEVGKGSTFTLHLLYEKTDIAAEEKLEEVEKVKEYLLADIKPSGIEDISETKDVEFDENDKRHTILILEDRKDLRDYIKEMLEKTFHVITAENGKIGLVKAKEHKPDLIVSDVMMPEMDGYELTKAIKADQELMGIPVILLTAKADVLMKVEGLEHGADDYLPKPFNTQELMARIRSQLKMKSLRDDISKHRDILQDEVDRQMKTLLKSEALKKYLPPQLTDALLSGKKTIITERKTERKKLTVFFSDIKGFTGTTDRMQPEELSFMLNDYFSEMTEIVAKHGGTVDKFIGDALIAYFGAFDSKGENEDTKACISMAIEMQQKMKSLQKHWKKKGIVAPFMIRCGINVGYCTIGNFGSEDRIDYTIIGSEVNKASRLQDAVEPGRILVSESAKLLAEDSFEFKDMGPITLKGFDYPIRCFEVVSQEI